MKQSRKNKDAKVRRVRAASERNKAYAGLSPIEQLAALDERLGKGKGAVKQRAKLTAKIKASK